MLQRLPNIVRARVVADMRRERLREAPFANALDQREQALLVEVVGIVDPTLNAVARGLADRQLLVNDRPASPRLARR